MARFGFIGGTYTSQSVTADAEECINLYPETVESQGGASAMTLYSTPGLKLFASVTGAHQHRGSSTINGRGFVVIDSTLYEVLANGMLTALGNVGNDGAPCSFAAAPQQLAVVSAGALYVYQLVTQTNTGLGFNVTIPAGTFQQITGANAPWLPQAVTQVAYLDGFFFVLVALSQTVYASNSFDATSWPPLSIKTINTFADNVISMISDHRLLYLLGQKSSETDYDAGSFPFPLVTLPSGTMEQGAAAQFATAQIDNTVFFIGQRSDQGGGIAWRISGSNPVRISTHAVELAWQSYQRSTKISDAVAFVYQDQGHTFWHVTFPSAQATWVYDVATNLWHRRGFFNLQRGAFQAALPISHMFLFGKHLVGDRASGRLYDMEIPIQAGGGWAFCDDNGNPIRRVRTAGHIAQEHQWMRYSELEVYCETGLGPNPPLLDGQGEPRGPQVMLRCSRDGGHTWGSIRTESAGEAGKYLKRVSFRRLGRARDMVFEVSVTDPVPWRFVDAYVNPKSQPSPRKRLVHQYAEVG